MVEMGSVRTGRHCIFLLHAHLVFVTKYRHRLFSDTHLRRMEEIMRAVCADFETELVEFNGENNHVHLLVNFPPKVALSKLVNSLKGVSSRRMRQEFPDLVRHYYRANRLWSGSYFAGSVGGAPLSVVRQYIEQQNRPVKNFGAVGYVLPRSEFLGRVAYSVATGDEDHRHRRNLGNFLGVLPCLAGQIHGGKGE